MTKVPIIDGRSTLTLPQELRERLGLKDGGQIVAEETENCILFHASAAAPIEIYSYIRLTKFNRNNEDALILPTREVEQEVLDILDGK